MSWTDQKPQLATEADTQRKWAGGKPGERFRCYLCGHKFVVGDTWRFSAHTKYSNFLVCASCDSPDVKDRWTKMNEELETRFWWAFRE